MTSVEALLTFEKGQVPAGVQVFEERDPEVTRARPYLPLTAFLSAMAVIAGLQGCEPVAVVVIAVAAAMSLVMAIPTRVEQPRKPRVLLLCDRGVIVREPWGLRNWRYDELVRLRVVYVDGRAQLCLEDKSGEAHLIDHLSFKQGEKLRSLIEQRMHQSIC